MIPTNSPPRPPSLPKAERGGVCFVADFYCASKKAVIELDGPVHEHRVEYDNFKDSELKLKGYNILRLKNEEIKNLTKVKDSILKFLNSIQT